MPDYLLPVQEPIDNPATVEGVQLGRRLFYDSTLAGNQKQSCANCHRQALAFTDGMEISTGSFGKKARRNSMSLVNLGWQDRYFWDGKALTLEELIHFPVTDTLEMNADTLEIERRLNKDISYKPLFFKAFGDSIIRMRMVTRAISQFLRTIVSYNSPYDHIFRDYILNGGVLVGDDYQILINCLGKGNEQMYGHDSALVRSIKQVSPSNKVLTVFSRCIKCHYNSLQLLCLHCRNPGIKPDAMVKYKNNGLETEGADKGLYTLTGKEEDKYRFKVPTFRNLVFSAPYMHDGRFKTLEEVVEHYNSGIQPNQNLDSLLKDENNKPIRFGLNKDEEAQLVGLLKLFTDSSVITEPRFAAPVKP